ncbi:hypothetical protein METBIDRAFT_117840 [Metschnikowia bicuspidata var. bicuspidata NRRL YB-4993]|uniref:Uncharacterized protein n=1 Tax=Metschnikowia bicuspidata var. bicuspidata NRRL YB-4993 TaxID=869754 RepID=A0A1A0HJW3_9ASCO|nr:hypothetical protein METBIDRAFT_117840 [Metschnikowia bicuspidata var. bicuspidata NRRL YB-4993]OBA24103.1 hypothetical protein METBIDRAFT_117840 [Metschnikowia bicuspidata var. bicuspidata NRRL YB-4993]
MSPTLGHPVFHISHLRLKHRIPEEHIFIIYFQILMKQYIDGSLKAEATEIVGHRKVATRNESKFPGSFSISKIAAAPLAPQILPAPIWR